MRPKFENVRLSRRDAPLFINDKQKRGDINGRNARALCIFNAIGMHRVKNIVTRCAIFLRTKEMSRRWRTSCIIRDTVTSRVEICTPFDWKRNRCDSSLLGGIKFSRYLYKNVYVSRQNDTILTRSLALSLAHKKISPAKISISIALCEEYPGQTSPEKEFL